MRIAKTIISAALCACALFSLSSPKQKANEYPDVGVVVSVNETTDEIIFETSNGNEFAFCSAKNYEVGDVIAVIMNDNGTTSVTDDSIICVVGTEWNSGDFALESENEIRA